ncbi:MULTISPECIES: NAD(P)/FAD-dependent oxidoreductase [unclassified Mucilaginibacter]|uniref:NAD(P)/FAD-dependent oxidoreductase n=1 Tax=unclassified Mucilaginibacter TaxID=2617802 RepID=UPI000965B013|nr:MULTISPECIES: NAD(P)/FAD-dependent oxidoreductase [unclassified Mucilaginibacter]OJW18540.1 MAG: DNA-binding protein [Mucilaginibacter sp. 44-25]PLW91040.1 MAG: aminoacetone oxidase family FAD-binding enzyme [Mucilaginibacter sp.]HEK20709.1 NAD(P)/FAD-dependent oxidoreductase [Bacteroidota bacterium]
MTANLTKQTHFDAIIIGGGACGLMCAVQAGFLGKRTLVLEKNDRVGAKILISGGGRCNYTNLHTTHKQFISNNEHFSRSALAQWTVDDTISFFETYGITGKEKTLGQLFPTTGKAKDIVEMFTGLCNDLDQQILCNTEVTTVRQTASGFEVDTLHNNRQETIFATKVVIASGGLPISKLGASDFGLRVARGFGMKVTTTSPALVPLTITGKDQPWYEQLSGNSIFCRVWNDRASFEENILFTHWGLSGPAILQISSYWKPGELIYIDMLPGQDIAELITSEREQNGKKSLLNYLAGLFTKKFADALSGRLPVNKNLASLSKTDLESISSLIHEFKVKPAGTKGYDKAEVMTGGVDTNELSSKTLEAKKIPGLFFGGECVDVTGWLGGYNFQWAWASGFVIAQNI